MKHLAIFAICIVTSLPAFGANEKAPPRQSRDELNIKSGWTAYEGQDFDGAIGIASKVIAENPGMGRAYELRAAAYLEKGLARCTNCPRPAHFEAPREKGDLYHDPKMLTASATDFEKAVALGETSLLNSFAAIYSTLGKYADAARVYEMQRQKEAATGGIEGWTVYHLANNYRAAGNKEQARTVIEQFLAKPSGHSQNDAVRALKRIRESLK